MPTASIQEKQTGLKRPVTAQRALRVYMLDLLPTVPYYTGYLCAALGSIDTLQVDVGAVTYYLDRDFFCRRQLTKDPALFDVAAHNPNLKPGIRRGLKAGEYLSNLVRLVVRFKKTPPDVLHVQFLPMVNSSKLPAELWFLKAMRRMGIPIVYTVHNVLPQDGGEGYRDRYQQFYNLADRLICHDKEAHDRLVKEFGIPAGRISIIAHGPLLEPLAATDAGRARKQLGLAQDEPMVLWQGIIKPYKGVSFLLKSWQKVKAQGTAGKLVIAGTGDADIMKELRDEAAVLGISDSVIMDMRFLSVAEVADYYAAADVITYPYREITTSGALMTGICYGKAIVASRMKAFATVLTEGENALIVDYGDADRLADHLKTLLESPSLRARLGEQAHRAFLSGPQWDTIAAQTAACYQKAQTAVNV